MIASAGYLIQSKVVENGDEGLDQRLKFRLFLVQNTSNIQRLVQSMVQGRGSKCRNQISLCDDALLASDLGLPPGLCIHDNPVECFSDRQCYSRGQYSRFAPKESRTGLCSPSLHLHSCRLGSQKWCDGDSLNVLFFNLRQSSHTRYQVDLSSGGSCWSQTITRLFLSGISV